MIKLSSKKIHDEDRQKNQNTDVSLHTQGLPPLFWRRFVHSLLITLAKINLDPLIKSLDTKVRCTATKFPEQKLLNKKRFMSVSRNCQM